MNILNNIILLKKKINQNVILLVVSKGRSVSDILIAYNFGIRHFGESYTKELVIKYNNLPKDILWHMIGNLQSNKIKYIVPFTYMIHSIDSINKLILLDKICEKYNKKMSCLLQIKISKEITKKGLNFNQIVNILEYSCNMRYIHIVGLMGISSKTKDDKLIYEEFKILCDLFNSLKKQFVYLKYLSMGMSSDYKIALSLGANIIRIGKLIFN